MRILILEDDPDRMKHFRRSAEACSGNGRSIEIRHVSTAEDCVQYLYALDFDFVFLDHDLDGRVYVDPREHNTGSEVARFLCRQPEVRNRHGKVIVHSFNEGAARVMAATIPNAEWIPGAWMLENFEPIVNDAKGAPRWRSVARRRSGRG